jgi:tripartite-type tricarboxylate transporter receptor subunit TctC
VIGRAPLLLAAAARPARAETYPARPIRLIVAFGPGSGSDVRSRLYADRLAAAWGQQVVVVGNDLPVRDMAGLIAHARAHPGALNYASGNTSSHLAAEMFKARTGVSMTYVSYRSNAQAILDVIAGAAGLPGYAVASWSAIVAPAGTPAEIVARLNAEVIAIGREPGLRARMADEGTIPSELPPEGVAGFVAQEVECWREAAHEAGIEPQ